MTTNLQQYRNICTLMNLTQQSYGSENYKQ